jgi:proteasome alpha subunit
MIEEPYRWLEAIRTRRDYIEDQLLPGQPVVVVSTPVGILFITVKGLSQKLFEVYDNMALGTVGHPADVEKVRQMLIDAAHVEGFNRSPRDVSARRLISYNLAPAMKAAFEQIFSSPILFRGILAEMTGEVSTDSLWTVDYGGEFLQVPATRPAVISGSPVVNNEWRDLAGVGETAPDLTTAAKQALRALIWARLRASKDQGEKGKTAYADVPEALPDLLKLLDGKTLEVSILDRTRVGKSITYRVPTLAELGLL